MEWADGKGRCAWANPANPRYIDYHDHEWGVPLHDDQRLFEMLVLECFQAGLSWECILNKREAFRTAFDGFDPATVAAFDEAKIEQLLANPGIVRNRQKINAAIGNAKVFCAMQEEFGSFDAYLRGWTKGETLFETGLATSPLSDQVSADLRKRGMRFVGSTVVYAYLQAVGVIDSHDVGCFLHAPDLSPRLQAKLDALRASLKGLGTVAVSFSGGADSTLLLAVAHEQLPGRVIAVTEVNALYPRRETDEAIAYCQKLGVPMVMMEQDAERMTWLAQNPRNHCYLCKTEMFANLHRVADAKAVELGLIESGQNIACVEGSNVSDRGDYRPGAQAVAEQGVLSPLDAAGLTKQDIRDISRELGLPTWNKPSFACLASRFVYGESITNQLLARVDAAEQLLLDAGFAQVRVRMHDKGETALVEVVPDRLSDALAFLQNGGSTALHNLGFKHVGLDADGYRTGSMN